MTVLAVIFWVLIILSVLSFWAPDPWVRYVRGVDLVLLTILGLAVFGFPR